VRRLVLYGKGEAKRKRASVRAGEFVLWDVGIAGTGQKTVA
jgi:hypothetical protein